MLQLFNCSSIKSSIKYKSRLRVQQEHCSPSDVLIPHKMLGSKRVKPTTHCIYHKPWPAPCELVGRISSTSCCNFMTSSVLNSGTRSSRRTPSSLITFFQKSSLIGLERSLAVLAPSPSTFVLTTPLPSLPVDTRNELASWKHAPGQNNGNQSC